MPLRVWQAAAPPSLVASREALGRLLGVPLHDLPYLADSDLGDTPGPAYPPARVARRLWGPVRGVPGWSECATSGAGHTPPGFAASRLRSERLVSVRVRLDGAVLVTEDAAGDRSRWYHHDVVRVRALLTAYGDTWFSLPGQYLFGVPQPEGLEPVCVLSSPLGPCRDSDGRPLLPAGAE